MKYISSFIFVFLISSTCIGNENDLSGGSDYDFVIYFVAPQIIILPISYYSKYETGGQIVGSLNFIAGSVMISRSIYLFYRPEYSRFGDVEKYAYLFGGVGLVGLSIYTFSNIDINETSHSRFLTNYFAYNSILLSTTFIVHNVRLNAGINYIQLQIQI